MFCPSCGTQNPDGTAFCSSCGAAMKAQAMGSTPNTGGGPVSGAPPKNWLVESILVTLFCCLPFGIAGIVNASKVESKFAMGDVAGAQKAAEEAAKWTKIGFFVGLGVIVLYFIFVVVLGVAGGLNGGF